VAARTASLSGEDAVAVWGREADDGLVEGDEIPGAGHFLVGENPATLTALWSFLG
jgi:hypothetical protein